MRTFHGHEIDYQAFLDGRPVAFDLRDIAHALSIEPRFCGHTLEPVSVASHSIRVYQRVCELTESVPESRRICRGALLHDASEAYLKDIPKDLKDLLPVYTMYECGCMQALSKHFDFPVGHSVIKQADEEVLTLEWLQYRADPPPDALRPALPDPDQYYWEPDRRTVYGDFFRIANRLCEGVT